MRKLIFGLLIYFTLFPNFTHAFNAMAGGSYSITAAVIPCGVGPMTSNGSFQVNSSIGQPTPIEPSGSATDDLGFYINHPGFWYLLNSQDAFLASLELFPGLNLIGYPVQLPATPSPYQASDLLEVVTNNDEQGQIQRFNGITFDLMATDGGTDFPIQTGEGYYLYLEEGKNIPFHGPKECALISVEAGLNLLTIPCPPTGYTSADLAADLGGSTAVSSIQRFNNKTGAFETTAFIDNTLIGTTFSLRRGEAYIVHMKQPAIITFSE